MQGTEIQCVGFIMDGNRRWSKEQNLPTPEGHQRGAEVFRESIEWVSEVAIPHAVYYAFSTENWNRSEEEVGYLMELFRIWLQNFAAQIDTLPIQVRFVGRREDFPESMQKLMEQLEGKSLSKKEIKTTTWIALSYGGRAEILAAVNEAILQGRRVTEEGFERLLWTAEMPDPDLIIRTGGEHRLSNFVTWKSVYSELFFLDKHWPALTKSDFNDILRQYEARERRKGA
jgi:undecaprenyl diphosphate synthase